jgi:benzoyl-CoA reductase/2-hydroxyglutaryl-CoA dehydratase subunit BcrC/BadD/HgdB
VVADDFACVGRRVYPAGKSDDPFRRMAERLLDGPPDSTRGSDVGERVRHLKKLSDQSGAKAILFFIVKFCEPELFYLPQMRAELEKLGLRSVIVEADVTDALPHQVVTRVEALMETVS